jgi:hypothetical protein
MFQESQAHEAGLMWSADRLFETLNEDDKSWSQTKTRANS